MEDRQLLQRYAADGSDEAFGQLVNRHLNLVYSAALRLTNGDAHLAQDVAQLVFTSLARKAATLAPDAVLAGWLHRDTCFTALEILRKERRRRAREQEAVVMNELERDSSPTDWQQIRPLLDEALNRLHPTDRDALLLRFFEQQSLAEIGERLGFGESGASRRVSRALDKLRDLLAARGVTTTGAALSVTLTSQAVQMAPAGLAAALTSASLGAVVAGTTTSTSTLGILQLMASTKLKLGLAALLATAVATPLVLQHQTSRELRLGNAQLQQEIEQLRSQLANQPAPQTATADATEMAQLRAEHAELLRLRGQVGRLRRELAGKMAPAKPAVSPQGLSQEQFANLAEPEEWRSGKFLPKEKISNVGLATPEAALQTYLWALLQEDTAVAKSVLADNTTVDVGLVRDEFADRLESAAGLHFDGYVSNGNSFGGLVSVQDSDGHELTKRVQLQLQDGNWRVLDDRWTPRKAVTTRALTQPGEGEKPVP